MKLLVGSIKNWADLEKLFLACFYEDDTEVFVPTLLATKQKKRESIKMFVERFRSMALCCPSGMVQSTLVETCRNNLQTTLLAQIEVVECRTWKQLMLQGEQAKESPGSRPKKRRVSQDRRNRRDALQNHLLNREERTLWNRG